ncbi:MAG: GTPase HflX, partial [Desulfofustis sp.]
MSRDQIIAPEMARTLCELSHELNRQIGVLIHRSGKIEQVIVGDHSGLMIPKLSQIRAAGGRLRGLSIEMFGADLTDDDLMDLLFLRLDLMSVLKITSEGLPEKLYSAHLLPSGENGQMWSFLDPVHPARQPEGFAELVRALEEEFSRQRRTAQLDRDKDRAILISVTTESRQQAHASLEELRELARSDDILVLGEVLQRRSKINPRYILGRGKLTEIVIAALRLDANLLIFNQELNPS